ncbi:MAG TPA: TIGR00366 family protein [bacterium]|nr:TIGR00366 family protein [bacterium]
MIERAAGILTRWALRWVPDSFVIAILLTVFVFFLALAVTPSTPLDLARDWGDGLWELLSFAMQMSLVIVSGFVVAVSPPVRRLLHALAGLAKTPRAQVALVAAVSMVLAWINWGLSIVASAMLARNVARRGGGVDYRLLVASAYLGMGCIWHAGLSGSVFLLVATPGHFLEKDIGTIPVTSTLFSPFNLALAAVVFIAMIALVVAMHPRPEQVYVVPPESIPPDPEPPEAHAGRLSFAQWVERSPLITAIFVFLGATWLMLWFLEKGPAGLNLNVLNLSFLVLGALLHRRPSAFLHAAEEGARYVWGVIVQFPLYAGIFGIIKFSDLQTVLSGWLATFVHPQSYPTFVLWYSGILNYIIPSGGSKWAIEAPYVLEAARALHLNVEPTIIAYAWGDMMTDIIQPFWALPLLAMTRLEFRDLMGYAILIFVVYSSLVTSGFMLFGG